MSREAAKPRSREAAKNGRRDFLVSQQDTHLWLFFEPRLSSSFTVSR